MSFIIDCFSFELSTTKQLFNESKEYCIKNNGTMVSSLLGDLGKSYHRYLFTETVQLKWFQQRLTMFLITVF